MSMIVALTAAVTAESAAHVARDAATAAALEATQAAAVEDRAAREARDAARDARDAERDAARDERDANFASNFSAFVLRDAESKAGTDARFDAIASNFSAFAMRFAEFRADTNARFDAMASNFALRFAEFRAETNARFDKLTAITVATKESVDEILDSSPTTSSSARVADCATSATFFFAAPIMCSAFAYAPPGEAPVFLTAAHCLTGLSGENWTSRDMQLYRVGSGDPLTCVVEKVFESPEDAAVLACVGAGVAAAGVSALSRAVGVPRLGLSVVAAGFVTDAFGKSPQFSLQLDPLITVKLTFSRISNVAGHWNNETCDVAHTGPAMRPAWYIEPGGYFDGIVTRGMSGGPVLNLRCFVVGITHGKGCESSVFARLDAVDKYLREKAEAAAKAAAEAVVVAAAA